MKKCKHEFRAKNNNSIGFYGVLLYCIHCGKAYTYDGDWKLYELESE